jgi:hypothetical protein
MRFEEPGPAGLEVVLRSDAIYSITFDDDRTGAVTLRDRMAASRDPGLALLDAFAARVTGNRPIDGYPDEPAELSERAAGWRVHLTPPLRSATRIDPARSDRELRIRLQ